MLFRVGASNPDLPTTPLHWHDQITQTTYLVIFIIWDCHILALNQGWQVIPPTLISNNTAQLGCTIRRCFLN